MDAEMILQRLRECKAAEDMSDETALSFIEAARVRLLRYCNIPLNAKMPEGLEEAWCELAVRLSERGYTREAGSVSEGDVTVKFSNDDGVFGLKALADRYRRLVF